MSADLFFTTNPGLEKGLKEEVKIRFPSWRGAFSAPGFLTYKTDREWSAQEASEIPLIFARFKGVVLSKVPIENLPDVQGLHWALRDHAKLGESLVPLEDAECTDIIRIDEKSAFLAKHIGFSFMREHVFTSPFGLPKESPSRAYLKLLEGLAFAGVEPGKNALELGSSPGGASYALLELGTNVMGVDTGPMSEACTRFPGPAQFRHIAKPMQVLSPRDLHGVKFQTLVCDVNLRPRETWEQLERLLNILAPEVRTLLWTVKMTHWDKVGEFLQKTWPPLEQQLKKRGKLRTAFLPSHHREFLAALSIR